MENANDIRLTIDSAAFESLRKDFNDLMKKTIFNMQTRGVDCAELNVKLAITLEKAIAPDFDKPTGEYRDILKPKFEHKVTSAMKIKEEESGSFKGEYELIWDEDINDFVARPIRSEQQTIFDVEYQEQSNTESDEDLIRKLKEKLSLPEPSEGEAEEPDCTMGYEVNEE